MFVERERERYIYSTWRIWSIPRTELPPHHCRVVPPLHRLFCPAYTSAARQTTKTRTSWVRQPPTSPSYNPSSITHFPPQSTPTALSRQTGTGRRLTETSRSRWYGGRTHSCEHFGNRVWPPRPTLNHGVHQGRLLQA